MKTLWQHCNVATMANGTYSIIEDAAIVTRDGYIEWLGPRQQLPTGEYGQTHGLEGAWVTPGLIDCHTHTVFGGNRSGEFEQRLQGVSYAEIAAAGGGIASTVRATRAASEAELFDSARQRLLCLLRDGVTSVEIKSGYGLSLESERKILRVIRRLGEELPVTVRSTCLAAHALPPEFKDRADDYIEHICNEMLPALAAEGLVDAVDAFCEYLAFSPAQVERVFKVAQQLGLPVKLHAEQLSSLHGSSLAARYQALSADHLEFMTEEDAIAQQADQALTGTGEQLLFAGRTGRTHSAGNAATGGSDFGIAHALQALLELTAAITAKHRVGVAIDQPRRNPRAFQAVGLAVLAGRQLLTRANPLNEAVTGNKGGILDNRVRAIGHGCDIAVLPKGFHSVTPSLIQARSGNNSRNTR